MNLSPAREKKLSRGRGLAGLSQGSAAARPLDGGVLTRWGARAPARGPTTAPRSLHRPLAHSVSSRSLLVTLREKRVALRDKEERSRKCEWSRVSDRGTRPRFCSREINAQPSISIRRPRLHGLVIGPRGRAWPRSFSSPGLGCGLGATVLASTELGRAQCSRQSRGAGLF